MSFFQCWGFHCVTWTDWLMLNHLMNHKSQNVKYEVIGPKLNHQSTNFSASNNKCISKTVESSLEGEKERAGVNSIYLVFRDGRKQEFLSSSIKTLKTLQRAPGI